MPSLSLLLPAGLATGHELAATMRSVTGQPFGDWELVVAGSRTALGSIREIVRGDGRVRLVALDEAAGPSRELNAGVAAARGEHGLLLHPGGALAEDALGTLAQAVAEDPGIDIWYGDQAELDAAGAVRAERLKPDWSPVFCLGSRYVGDVFAVRLSLCRDVPFLPEYDGVERYELLLRASERGARVGRIPRVLTRVPAAGDPHAAIRREPLQQRAAAAHLARLGRSWRLRPEGRYPGRLLIKAGRDTQCPSVSIVIPTRDQGAVVERCLRSIYALTDYPDFEVVVVDNRTVDGVAKAAFARFPVVHVRYDEDRFNYSAANNLGVSRSRGELVLFLNNDTEIVEPDWLRDLVLFFEDPEIGAIGPTLLYPNGAVQHAGVVLGSRGTADHAMRHLPGDGEGPDGALVVAREVSAVTAACLMTPRRLFDELGGFSTDYAAHYQDLDLCLKIRRSGRRIISAGFPRVVHHESLSRGGDGYDQGDRALLIDAWREVIAAGDPYYHPRLDLARLDFTPAA